jgi:hypothetical protein
LLIVAGVTRLDAATVTAQWDPNSEPDLAGYVLSYGSQSGQYTTTVDVGNVTTYSLSVDPGQTYYFAVQAYNTAGVFSPYSSEVAYAVPAGAPTITALSPASGGAGALITITGSNFGATQAASTLVFNATAAAPQSWSNTTIVAPVPAAASSGPVIVTVGGESSNGVMFTVDAPSNGLPGSL